MEILLQSQSTLTASRLEIHALTGLARNRPLSAVIGCLCPIRRDVRLPAKPFSLPPSEKKITVLEDAGAKQ